MRRGWYQKSETRWDRKRDGLRLASVILEDGWWWVWVDGVACGVTCYKEFDKAVKRAEELARKRLREWKRGM